MGIPHLAVFIVGCLILAAVAWKQPGTFLRRARRFGLFLGLLLIAGSFFNGLWSCLIYGRFYVSADPVAEFNPFLPVNQAVIEAPFGNERGQLLGVSLFQLQLIWLPFAAATWAAAILSFRLLRKHLSANKALQVIPATPGI
jgi:hypothetical protein